MLSVSQAQEVDGNTVIQELNIDYIIITDEMKYGLVWTEDEQGMLFLLRNNETFKKIYVSPDNSTELWEVI